MKSAKASAIVLTTAPNITVARKLARAALNARLIACANLFPRMEAHYRWKGKVETGAEVLMLLKTKRTALSALEKLILEQHPYDTPEFLVLPLTGGNARYLKWIADSTA